MSTKYQTVEPHLDLFSRGFDSFGHSPLIYAGSEVNQKARSMYEAGVPSVFIQDGDIIRRLNVIDGWLQSNGFVSGTTGWRIDSDGNAEFADGTFRGDVVGATITGSTIWAKNTGTGIDVKVGSDGVIYFYLGGTEVGQISAAGTGTAMGMYGKTLTVIATLDALTDTYVSIGTTDLTIKAEDDLVLEAKDLAILRSTGASGQVQITASGTTAGQVYVTAGDDANIYESDTWRVNYNSDNDSSGCLWKSNSVTKMTLSSAGALATASTMTPGADIAELFESTDGKKIPNGTPVVLYEGKVREAIVGEKMLGVISATASSIGNLGGQDADTAWSGKYLINKDGSPVLEIAEFWSIRKVERIKKKLKTGEKEAKEKFIEGDSERSGWSDEKKPPKDAILKMVERRKVNPEWDSSQEYVSRVDRDEWNIVGLLGVVLIKNGAPVSPNWTFIKEANDEYNKYLIK